MANFGNNHLAYGAFAKLRYTQLGKSAFGKLSVRGMAPVSDFRQRGNNLLIMPFGPPGPWIEKGHEGAASSSSAFGAKHTLGDLYGDEPMSNVGSKLTTIQKNFPHIETFLNSVVHLKPQGESVEQYKATILNFIIELYDNRNNIDTFVLDVNYLLPFSKFWTPAIPFNISGALTSAENKQIDLSLKSLQIRLNNSAFGMLAKQKVNPSGYIATWYGQPRTAPPSWNPLLMQGGNIYPEGIDSPRLSNVVAFGARKSKSKSNSAKKSVKKSASKPKVKSVKKTAKKRN